MPWSKTGVLMVSSRIVPTGSVIRFGAASLVNRGKACLGVVAPAHGGRSIHPQSLGAWRRVGSAAYACPPFSALLSVPAETRKPGFPGAAVLLADEIRR